MDWGAGADASVDAAGLGSSDAALPDLGVGAGLLASGVAGLSAGAFSTVGFGAFVGAAASGEAAVVSGAFLADADVAEVRGLASMIGGLTGPDFFSTIAACLI